MEEEDDDVADDNDYYQVCGCVGWGWGSGCAAARGLAGKGT